VNRNLDMSGCGFVYYFSFLGFSRALGVLAYDWPDAGVWCRNTFAGLMGGSCLFVGELVSFFGSHFVSYLRLARGPCNTQATQELVLISPHEVRCAY
jgi:hypothetical protein